jgi:hypothetical protein
MSYFKISYGEYLFLQVASKSTSTADWSLFFNNSVSPTGYSLFHLLASYSSPTMFSSQAILSTVLTLSSFPLIHATITYGCWSDLGYKFHEDFLVVATSLMMQ